MILDRLSNHAQRRPDHTALFEIESGRIWSWADLHRAAQSVAAQLQDKLNRPSPVLLCQENSAAFVAAFLGILAAGCDAFCVSPDSPPAELHALAASAGTVAFIGSRHKAQRLNPPIAIASESIAAAPPASAPRASGGGGVLLPSSGTTGLPKIVRRDAPSLDAMAEALCIALAIDTQDRLLAATPLCHSYGLEHGLLAPIWAGASTYLSRSFDATAIAGLLNTEITLFPGIPFMYESLAQARPCPPGTKSPLRRAYSAGGPLSASAAESFAHRHGIRVGQVYGSTEVGSVTFSDPTSPTFAPASVGAALPSASIQIDPATSEVLIRSPWMFHGYLGLSSQADWLTDTGQFKTGDLGRLDEHGNLFLTGRMKLMIDVGGRKVNPLEVESVLANHPSVGQCVVVPMAVDGNITRLRAVVTPRENGAAPCPAELRRFVKDQLAGYKVPRVFEVRASLPLSPAGKVLRHLIQE